MLVKLILISTICSFVYARSVESPGEIQHRLSLIGEPRFDSIMDAEPSQTETRHVIRVPTGLITPDEILPRPVESRPITNHESHLGMKHLKKRAMNYKEDHQVDLRPGCCG
ncbi:uncharacterized protein LOC114880351 [Osmia bicornis bicornis]|uniref:uncharacterized protein LOC114880351 n=1 Tax=Osmia bicornis bicornis TaxID=1437191 RepID=UPI0010F8490B|nr:uncharacterized protein LOC114880351 [Osmia bicornis bicornis]